VTDAERDVKLRESVADVIACPHTYPSGSDYVKADRVMQIILAEQERVRQEEARWWKEWAIKYSMGVSAEGRQAAYDRALADRS
jgi:hypothetical protein